MRKIRRKINIWLNENKSSISRELKPILFQIRDQYSYDINVRRKEACKAIVGYYSKKECITTDNLILRKNELLRLEKENTSMFNSAFVSLIISLIFNGFFETLPMTEVFSPITGLLIRLLLFAILIMLVFWVVKIIENMNFLSVEEKLDIVDVEVSEIEKILRDRYSK